MRTLIGTLPIASPLFRGPVCIGEGERGRERERERKREREGGRKEIKGRGKTTREGEREP